MTARVLVAGIGNIFLGDDGFGVEVVNRLSAGKLPAGVEVADFGIRGVHLAYELLDGRHDTTILVDALPRGGEPGTLYVLKAGPAEHKPETVDAHGMDPATVLALVNRLGGTAGRVLVVGCEPASVDEGIGLSPAVAAAVDEAARRVHALAEQESGRERSEADVSRHPG